jgi:SUMO ligase MMS21 Smc5/6 complex component
VEVLSLIQFLESRGAFSDAAIDHIYSVYGRSSSVTAVLNGLRYDKKRRHLDIYGIRRSKETFFLQHHCLFGSQ